MSASDRQLLAIGRIVKAFGVKGDVAVEPLTDQPARFRNLTAAYIGRQENDVREIGIARAAVEPRGVRLHLAGVDDRTAAERLVGQFLFVGERDRIRPGPGRFFVHQVVGLAVVDEAGRPRGVVREVLKYPAQDVYRIGEQGREFLLPAVREFVLDVDLERRVMRVRLIEGIAEA